MLERAVAQDHLKVAHPSFDCAEGPEVHGPSIARAFLVSDATAPPDRSRRAPHSLRRDLRRCR